MLQAAELMGTETEKEVPSLASRAVVARLRFRLMGLSERDKKITHDVNQNHLKVRDEAGHYQKIKLDRKDVTELLSLVERARAYYRQHTRPFGDDGVRLLPVTRTFEYTKEMGKFKREFDNALKITADNWDAIVEKQRERLQHLFNPKNYPAADEVRTKYRMEWSILPVPEWSNASDQNHVLMQIDKDLANDIREQVKEDQTRILYETQDTLWERLMVVVGKVAERYMNPRAQIYRSSLVNIEKTVEIVQDLNFTDDPDIPAICREIKDTLFGWTPKQIRKDQDLRMRIGRRAEAICEKIRARMEAGVPVT